MKLTVYGLLFVTGALYLTGIVSGFHSAVLFVLLFVVFLGQMVMGMVKRVKGLISTALIGLGLLALWKLAGAIHSGVKQLYAQSDVFPSTSVVSPVVGVGASLLPGLLLVALFVMLFKKANVKAGAFFEGLGSFSFGSKREKDVQHPSVRICKDTSTNKEVVIKGADRFTHALVIGPTGSGKTALTFQPMVYQDIEYIAAGNQASVVIIEPDGEFSQTVANYSNELNVEHIRIDATNPIPGLHWNPLEGDASTVAETVTTVLLTKGSNPFFADVQNNTLRNTMLLMKLLHGDDLVIGDVAKVLRDLDVMKQEVLELKVRLDDGELNDDEEYIAENVIGSLLPELDGGRKQEKFAQVTLGLRQKIDNLIGNPGIRKIMSGKSTFRFEEYFEKPSVLLINTGNNAAGDMFGSFVLLSLQAATLSRPGTAETRSGIFTYIDEFARYATMMYQSAFTQGRKFRNAQTIAFQSFGQLDLDGAKTYREVIQGNCRNKIVLSGLEYRDAQEAENMMGETDVKDESVSYAKGFLTRDGERKNVRTVSKARYSASHLMSMPWNHVVYKIVIDKQMQIPSTGLVDYAKKKTLDQIKVNTEKGTREVERVNFVKMTQALRQTSTKVKGWATGRDGEQAVGETDITQTVRPPYDPFSAQTHTQVTPHAPKPHSGSQTGSSGRFPTVTPPIEYLNRGGSRPVTQTTPSSSSQMPTVRPAWPVSSAPGVQQTMKPTTFQEAVRPVVTSQPEAIPISEPVAVQRVQPSILLHDEVVNPESVRFMLESLSPTQKTLLRGIGKTGKSNTRQLADFLRDQRIMLHAVIGEINEISVSNGLDLIVEDRDGEVHLTDAYREIVISWLSVVGETKPYNSLTSGSIRSVLVELDELQEGVIAFLNSRGLVHRDALNRYLAKQGRDLEKEWSFINGLCITYSLAPLLVQKEDSMVHIQGDHVEGVKKWAKDRP